MDIAKIVISFLALLFGGLMGMFLAFIAQFIILILIMGMEFTLDFMFTPLNLLINRIGCTIGALIAVIIVWLDD